MAGNDTMPIRIPISMDAQKLDADAIKSAASFKQLQRALKDVKK